MKADQEVTDQGTIRENKLDLVERLADDLAHEIKNPLHSMVINLEVLRRRLARLSNRGGDDLLRYTAVLSSELDRVNRRVDLLLRMVRPQRESDDPTTLADVLEELRELVELECERHHLDLRMEMAQVVSRATLPRAATRQMILSLILKTLDSASSGGSLHLDADVESGVMRLHVYALDEQGRSSSAELVDGDDSYLSVARALAERLGGQLDTVTPSHLSADGSLYVASGYALSLPR